MLNQDFVLLPRDYLFFAGADWNESVHRRNIDSPSI